MNNDEGRALTRQAISATLHCLTGCAIGEVLGVVIGTALGWGNGATIALAIGLAFLFGYALTVAPVLRAGWPARRDRRRARRGHAVDHRHGDRGQRDAAG